MVDQQCSNDHGQLSVVWRRRVHALLRTVLRPAVCCAAFSYGCWQVLWGGSGTDPDIIAGVEAAILDGVDVLTASLGANAEFDTMATPVQVAYMNAGGCIGRNTPAPSVGALHASPPLLPCARRKAYINDTPQACCCVAGGCYVFFAVDAVQQKRVLL